MLSTENESLKDNLYVVLKKTKYELAKKIDKLGFETSKSVGFTDKQKAHKEFWSIYARPPKEEYWDYIIGRRDLLVPQDIRERKGSFFTPQIWVEKSQQYLADVLGETWQDEYYIWDNCAGTGNLLNGLTNPRNIFASTIDKQDVDVMIDRIKNGWSMFEDHIFQFDFLNDEFIPQSKGGKMPDALYGIITDEEKRKKLVIYINPPYAEAGTGTGKSKAGITNTTRIYEKYKSLIGKASKELYAQFFIRIYKELKGCILGEFSKIKVFQASNFQDFRNEFNAKLEKLFIVPAWTFDNVIGEFPIGFFVWNTNWHGELESSMIEADVFDEENNELSKKKILVDTEETKKINAWLRIFKTNDTENIGVLMADSPDFANQKYVCFINKKTNRHGIFIDISKTNIIPICIYLAVRQCIPQSWLNDRDQFLFPKDGWQNDKEFQSDCLIYSLFHGQNRITSEHGINHFIPFTEQQVGSKKAFKSNFMSKFLNGEIEVKKDDGLFSENQTEKSEKIVLSDEAQAVYDAGLELWKYYHSQPKADPDASFYGIRKFFQGESKGKMNNSSDDEKYMELIGDLRDKMKLLAKKIEPKVYEYGFLK